MELFGWILVISLGSFVLSVIVLGLIILFKLRKKTNIHATIFLESGSQTSFYFNRKKKSMTIDEKTYNMNEKAIHKTAWYDYIYFFENNPEPIIYNHNEFKPVIPASELTKILEDNSLQELLTQGEMQTIQLLLIIALCSGVITMVMIIIIMSKGVKIKITPELTNMIYNVTKTAITGG
jgi:uncharacterized membrane protein